MGFLSSYTAGRVIMQREQWAGKEIGSNVTVLRPWRASSEQELIPKKNWQPVPPAEERYIFCGHQLSTADRLIYSAE